ncbi:MAG: hypothetical protein EBX50_12670 [Chitinophagia bacterium]|nr:hypothetical protein [Chitinophagia bacterium]
MTNKRRNEDEDLLIYKELTNVIYADLSEDQQTEYLEKHKKYLTLCVYMLSCKYQQRTQPKRKKIKNEHKRRHKKQKEYFFKFPEKSIDLPGRYYKTYNQSNTFFENERKRLGVFVRHIFQRS